MRMTEAVAAKAAMMATERGDPTRVWYGVRSATRQEQTLADGLKRIGIETYQPELTFWRRLRSKKTKANRALLPGYLFVLCTPADFDSIHAVDGFHQFVRAMADDGMLYPLPFPDVAIGDLMMRQAKGDFDDTRAEPDPYRPAVGERAIVTGGTWYDFVVEVLSLNPSKRQARVKVMGMNFPPVTLPYKNLDAA